jgi:hypothetical protein
MNLDKIAEWDRAIKERNEASQKAKQAKAPLGVLAKMDEQLQKDNAARQEANANTPTITPILTEDKLAEDDETMRKEDLLRQKALENLPPTNKTILAVGKFLPNDPSSQSGK